MTLKDGERCFYLSREELLRSLNEMGLPVSYRQIRHWEKLQLIPRGRRNGKCVYYSKEVLPQAAAIYKLKSDLRAVLRLHGNSITRVILSDKERKYVEELL